MYAHLVRKGETIYSLCKAYDVTPELLQKSNPALSQGLKNGQILYIPIMDKEDISDGNGSISEQGIEKDDRISQRKRRKERKERKKSKPEKHVIEEGTNTTEEESADTTKSFSGLFPELYQESHQDSYQLQTLTKEHNTLAFLLPLTNSNGTVSHNYMDFYAGALLAAEDLKSEGYNLTLNIIDCGSGISNDGIMESDKVKAADLLIGPVRSKAIKEFAEFSENNAMPVISPLDPSADSLLSCCEFLFQAPVAQYIQNNAIVEMIMRRYNSYSEDGIAANVVVVYQDGSKDSKTAVEIIEKLYESGINANQISYDILNSRSMEQTFKSKVPVDKYNLVAIVSNSEAFASDALRHIDILAAEDGHITLFGTSKWRGFEAINLGLYFKYNMQLAMPYYIDLSSDKVQGFVKRFRSLFNTEPSATAFSGYDMTSYFAKALRSGLKDYLAEYKAAVQSGDNATATRYIEFINSILEEEELLQQNLKFVKGEGVSGFSNHGLKIVRYNSDYSISVIR